MNVRNLAHGLFVIVLGASLVFSMAYTEGHAATPIAAIADDIQALGVGDAAPRFTVETVNGDSFEFNPAELERPVILAAFRGGWCPYCNTYLSEMRHVVPQIEDLGVDILFLSGDRAELLYESLSYETQEDIEGLDYTILSDANAEAAIAFGIAFRSSQRTADWLQQTGKGYSGSSVERHGVLPVPAVFAVGKDGVIRFAFTNADYRVRLPADELLAVAQSMATD